MHQVRDGARTLQFNGELLAASSSERPGSNRWVEFELYRTTSGSYVLARRGISTIYHLPGCEVIARNHLKPGELVANSVPCEECGAYGGTEFYVERPRYWAQVSESPDAVVEALMKYDSGGTRYLTQVAKRLLERASEQDNAIEDAYRIEHVR